MLLQIEAERLAAMESAASKVCVCVCVFLCVCVCARARARVCVCATHTPSFPPRAHTLYARTALVCTAIVVLRRCYCDIAALPLRHCSTAIAVLRGCY